MARATFAADAARREQLVWKLARETGIPIDEARRAFEQELRTLARDARVGYYLPVLAARSAKEQLRHRS